MSLLSLLRTGLIQRQAVNNAYEFTGEVATAIAYDNSVNHIILEQDTLYNDLFE